jgi:glyoxylase-like metal-dependent hydrolase (beta-lactamase superfamily II)
VFSGQKQGLVEVADGVHVWLPPDGSWGWSNAGLISDNGQTMIVDTLFDLSLTRTMLEEMERVVPTAKEHVDILVNTHANGDHCHGNELVPTQRIIASIATAEEMADLPPAALGAMVRGFENDDSPLGRYIRHAFGAFDFSNITMTMPTETFTKNMAVTVGDIEIELIEVGPAHTGGDVLAYAPSRGVVFTGDILFIEGTPLMWAGPVDNWIAACDLIASMDAITVPGHGPISDAAGARAVRDYWVMLRDEAKIRYEAGMNVHDAVRDIDLGSYADWGESERVYLNVNALYREFGSTEVVEDVMELFAEMGLIWEERS